VKARFHDCQASGFPTGSESPRQGRDRSIAGVKGGRQSRPVSFGHCASEVLFRDDANRENGVLHTANREIGVPG